MDFNNFTQVTKCELVGLSDLRTESDHVRARSRGYLNKLLSYGVRDSGSTRPSTSARPIWRRSSREAAPHGGRRPAVHRPGGPAGRPGQVVAVRVPGRRAACSGFDFATQCDAFKSYAFSAGNIPT